MKKRISAVTACLLAFVLLLSGCGSSPASVKNDSARQEFLPEEKAYYEDAAPSSRTDSYALVGDASYAGKNGTSEAPKENNAAEAGRKLVKTMSFNIETQDFDKSTADISVMVNALGGYIEDASVSGNSYRKYETRTAAYILRIPVSSLAEFTGKIGSIGNVTSRSEQVKDITLSYADTESRLKALEAQRDSLIEMMGKAEKLEDLLTIQDHLAGVEYELENYASRIRLYDNQVEYSSVSIRLQEVKIYTEPAVEPETFGDRIAAAFKEGLESIGEFFRDLTVFLAGCLPSLALLGVIVAVIVLIVRKIIKKQRAKKAAAAVKNDNSTITEQKD